MKNKVRSHVGLDWKSPAERHSSFQLIGNDGRWVANVDMAQFADEDVPRIRRVITSPAWSAERKPSYMKALHRWAFKMHRASKPHHI